MSFNKFLLLIVFFSPLALSAQYVWTAGGDGASWNDPANWNRNEVPLADSVVVLNGVDTISGTAPNNPVSVKIGTKANITLDLDLTIGNGTTAEHGITFGDTCSLTLGLAQSTRTITVGTTDDKQAVAIFGGSEMVQLNINSGVTLNLNSGVAGMNLANAASAITNDGTVNFNAGLRDGARVVGSFTNNGTIAAQALGRDAFNLKDGGILTNSITGTITADQPGDDGVEIISDATFVNDGTLIITAKDNAGSANSCIAVGNAETTGTFVNNGASVTLDGGGGEGELSGRALAVETGGLFTNNGVITISGGSDGSRLFVKGEGENALNGTIDLTDGRFNVNASGVFTNNGLMKTTRDGSGGFVTGTAINNAFFDYANSNQFAGGANGTIVDKGFSLNNNDVRVNARNNCDVDLVNAPYEWFLDAASYGMASDTGAFSFAENSLQADSVVLTTTIPGVEVKVINICPEAVMTNGLFGARTQVQKVRVFPNPVSEGSMLSLDLSALPAQPIKFAVFNGQGSLVRELTLICGQTTSFNIGDLPKGIFFLRGRSADRQLGGTFMVN